MKRRAAAVAAVVVIATTGGVVAAAIDDDPAPSAKPAARPTAACDAAMIAFADDPQLTRNSQGVLEDCVSAADWLAAYRDHPTMIGGSTAPVVDQIGLVCSNSWPPTAAVCVDAERRDLIEGEAWPE